MLVLTGPSASGKTEVSKILIEKYHLKKLITYTTRPIREHEKNGVDYHFISVPEFLKMKENNEFVETTFYNNNYYGSRKSDIAPEKLAILDPNGVNQYYTAMDKKIVSIFLDAPEDVRKERMFKRKDPFDTIERRIISDRDVFRKDTYLKLDFVVKNLDISLDYLAAIIYKFYITQK
jgi:guanylate kinase